MCSQHTRTLDIKGPVSVPGYSSSLRRFLCYRLKSPTCLSFSVSLPSSTPPPLRVNFRTQRSDEEEGWKDKDEGRGREGA